MADNDKRKIDIPWGTVLPLAAVLAGVVAQYKPLLSERPSVPSEKTAPVIAAQDVDARLWQDPIGVAQKQKALLDEQIDKGLAKKGATELHDIAALAQLLGARQAVLEGLSESGFVPIDGEHIGFVTTQWPLQTDNVPSPWSPPPPACA